MKPSTATMSGSPAVLLFLVDGFKSDVTVQHMKENQKLIRDMPRLNLS
jgi:hypothetical protein